MKHTKSFTYKRSRLRGGWPLMATVRRKLGFGTVVLLFLSIASALQASVVVDEWGSPSIFINANNTTSFDVMTEQGPIASGVLGGWRRFRVENLGEDGNVFFNVPVPSGTNVAETGETSTAAGGKTTVIWDGSAGPRDADDDLIPLAFDTNNDVSSGLNFDLGGVDFQNACVSSGEARISVLVRVDQAVTVPFTIKMFTAADQWSSLTVNVPPGAGRPLYIADFPFSSFVSQGTGSNPTGGGADFQSINAVALVSESDNGDEDIDFFQIQSCGFDFGDAPETAQLAGRYYTTTLAVKADLSGFDDGFIRNNTQPGPRHRIGGPFLGTGTNDTDSETDGQPDAAATGDDNAGVDDEQGIVGFPPMGEDPGSCDGLEITGDSNLYCVAVEVSNPTDVAAQVVGWIDFSGGGVFSHNGCGTSTNGLVLEDRVFVQAFNGFAGTGWGCDRSAAGVRLGATGLSQIDTSSGAPTCPAGSSAGTALQAAAEVGGGSWTTGNVPPNCEGIVVLVWDLSDATQVTAGETFARFRITTDSTLSTFFAAEGPRPFGEARDGEVEDHRIGEGTIPVNINAFESRFIQEGLEVIWSTASETHNQGFYIWGETSQGAFELLTPDMVTSTASDVASPQQYRTVIPGLREGSVRELVITAVDFMGDEDLYGYFAVGEAFGEENLPAPIDWLSIRGEVEQRLAQRGEVIRGGLWRPGYLRDFDAFAADFEVANVGMQRITYEQLAAAGLDLAGVNPYQIAVTVNGKAVARHVQTPPRRGNRSLLQSRSGRPSMFGPGSAIYFWGESPSYPDALYVDQLVYRVSVEPTSVLLAADAPAHRAVSPTNTQWSSTVLAERNDYNFGSPANTPWYMANLRNWVTEGSTFAAQMQVSDINESAPAKLRVHLSGVTALPQTPNHRILVLLNDELVYEHVFSGRSEEWLNIDLDGGTLNAGLNEIEIQSPGFEGLLSGVLLHGIELQWQNLIEGDGVRAHFAPLLDGAVDGVIVEGLPDSGELAGFARTESGKLYRVQARRTGQQMATASIPSGYDALSVWVSGESGFYSPASLGGVPSSDLIASLDEFDHEDSLLIIAHPAFLPDSALESHPLNDFVSRRVAAGWSVSVVSVSDIQVQYGGGMPLPGAVTSFIADARASHPFSHVLLVGADSYDYLNDMEPDSISFIPTLYSPTQFVNFTPSDALLTDVTGDGVSDVAVGRWPVRTMADLAAAVEKVFLWEDNLAADRSALFMTDEQDLQLSSFGNHAERLASILTNANWSEDGVDVLIYEDFGNASDIRDSFFSALEAGKTLTGYSGHGAPTAWSRRNILLPHFVADLNNDLFPTLIGTKACYTTYFVSPKSDTLAHRLMNGMRIDSQGEAIPATNGAVAIHGAATLSSLAQNEMFAREVLQAQLDGYTLGQAILHARKAAADRSVWDLVVNWTLLGDPTLRLQ